MNSDKKIKLDPEAIESAMRHFRKVVLEGKHPNNNLQMIDIALIIASNKSLRKHYQKQLQKIINIVRKFPAVGDESENFHSLRRALRRSGNRPPSPARHQHILSDQILHRPQRRRLGDPEHRRQFPCRRKADRLPVACGNRINHIPPDLHKIIFLVHCRPYLLIYRILSLIFSTIIHIQENSNFFLGGRSATPISHQIGSRYF